MSRGLSEEPLLLAIVGPTASGKSHLAVQAALHLQGEIVNCDSMQMIRHLDLGTAKPSLEERRKVPHHLYDVIEPDEYYSAGRYMKEGRRLCHEIAARGKVPVVVGGTGLYLRSLLEGLFEGPGPSPTLRRRLQRIAERKGTPYLHRWLERKDPAGAAEIAPGDRIRLVRALEVYYLTGQPISRLQARRQPLEGFRVLKVGLGLPRPELYGRINRRVEQMFEQGLLEEVRGLLDRGYSPECKGFEALGYRQAVAVLRGEMDLQEAIRQTQQESRRYAKRQLTWFRREKQIRWLDRAGEDPAALQTLLAWVEELSSP